MLKLSKLFVTIIAMAVTFAANAQTFTDQTRARGWFDFYTAILADTSLHTGYLYVSRSPEGRLRYDAEGRVEYTSEVGSSFNELPELYAPKNNISDNPLGRAENRWGTFVRYGDAAELLTTHLTGKVGETELSQIHSSIVSEQQAERITLFFSVLELEVRLRITRNQLDIAPLDTAQVELATAQERVTTLTNERDARPTQAELDTAQMELTAAQERVMTLTNERDARPTQAELDTAQADLATAQERARSLTSERDGRPTQAELDAVNAQIALLEAQIRELGAEPVAVGGGGGSSGAGALGAVALAGGAYYWWKKQNPNSKLSFMAMPTDTDAYVAEFNATPKENLHFNVRYSEGNLFADSDFVKPETNSTVMATVKWTW